jgi:hypothetical protein
MASVAAGCSFAVSFDLSALVVLLPSARESKFECCQQAPQAGSNRYFHQFHPNLPNPE